MDETKQKSQSTFGIWFYILFPLAFLLGGNALWLFNLDGLQARFSGVQTTALVSVAHSCGDGNFVFTFTFTDTDGETHHITNESLCTNDIVTNGTHVTLWYLPNDPGRLITENDIHFYLILDGIFSLLAVALWLAPVFLWLLDTFSSTAKMARERQKQKS